MAYYWQLILWDGDKIKVKPSSVEAVQAKMKAKEDIPTKSRVIVYKNIKDFVQTDERYVENAISSGLEEASRAFKEPIETEEGILFRPVKKRVTTGNWEKRYSQVPGYTRLSEDDGMVTIGVWMASHLIDYALVEDCTEEEAKKMDGKD